jgi:hypothetical protein
LASSGIDQRLVPRVEGQAKGRRGPATARGDNALGRVIGRDAAMSVESPLTTLDLLSGEGFVTVL